jgi:hypothetical protein
VCVWLPQQGANGFFEPLGKLDFLKKTVLGDAAQMHGSTEPVYKYLGLTVVRYTDGDHLGQLLSLITLSPVFLAVAYATLLLGRGGELQIVILCVGQVSELTSLSPLECVLVTSC